jgi:hypothetical protein
MEEACARLADDLEHYWSSDEALNEAHKERIASIRAAGPTIHDDVSELKGSKALTAHIFTIVQQGEPPSFKNSILQVLADATRQEPIWRSLFGLRDKRSPEHHLAQLTGRADPDSIVEICRRIIAGRFPKLESDARRSALRIIANCCANNNVNRSIIVYRDGIETLLQMIREHHDHELAIPTLYNVCVDFDEPAKDIHGTPWPPLQQRSDEQTFVVSAADQRLGTDWHPHPPRKTTFETLLNEGRDADDAGLLCELLEMASRVVLYGTEHVHQRIMSSDAGDVQAIDTTETIIDQLLTTGAEIVASNEDCRESILQAILNFFSQTECQKLVLRYTRYISVLVNLPATMKWGDSPLPQAEQAFLKLIYQISALEEYAEVMSPESDAMTICIAGLDPQTNSPVYLAGILVLIANSITTIERAEQLVRSSPITSLLGPLLQHDVHASILGPATDLATRLALCEAGREALIEGGMTKSISIILSSPVTSQVASARLEIQRNATTLLRLLIKRQLAAVLAITDDLVVALLKLFEVTTDDQTKAEIGRLSIEIVRTVYTAIKTNQEELSAAPRPFLLSSADTAEELLTLTDTIAFLIPDSEYQSQAQVNAEAEAWFGLALLAMFPTLHHVLIGTLTRSQQRLLERLRWILVSSQKPHSSTEGDTDSRFEHVTFSNARYQNAKALARRLVNQDEEENNETLERIRSVLQASLEDKSEDWVVV